MTALMDTKMTALMDTKMKARLEADGWTVGSTQSFLGLSDEDMASIDMKLALAIDSPIQVPKK